MAMAYNRLFFIVVFIAVCKSYDGPEVDTPLGKLRGLWKLSNNGNKYSSFEGIPYAQPPIGDLRFEEPEPIEPWKGTWEATQAQTCLQVGMVSKTIEGSEDCLYLNVYVPGKNIKPDGNYDVHVHIHGGAFMGGSGHVLANADSLMDHEGIILVSINYRLSAFGFLSTEDKEIPGNNGMKDQVLALKWVKNNIKSLGGNPDSITLTGYSAGGASVHLHYLSPLSKGLFHRAISHSGVALNPWVIKEEPLIFAKNLSAELGCPTSSSKLMKDCLKTRPSTLFLTKIASLYEYIGRYPFSPFAPVVEKNSNNPFLPENPYYILKNGKVADVPWIAAVTKDEGMLPAASFCTFWDQVNQEFEEKAHLFLDYNHTLPVSERQRFAAKLRNHYLGKDKDINEDTYRKLFDICTHRLFLEGIEIAVKLQSKVNKSPVYYYYFNYNKGANSLKYLFCPQKKLEGVCHADDAIYIYGVMSGANIFSDSDKKLASAFKMMLDTFIKGKEPSLNKNVKWLPSKGEELTYLHIIDGEDLKIEKTKSMVPDGIWDELNIVEYNLAPAKTEL